MASGHVNRTNRPNTWLHRPNLQREESSCQLGAVHTWHLATFFWSVRKTVAIEGWSQPVDATLALNLSAGVSIPKALRGRSLSRRTTLFRWAFEDTDNRLSSEITEYTPSLHLSS